MGEYFFREIVQERKSTNGKSRFEKIKMPIICKLIVFDNKILLAEEIVTKQTFPIVLINKNNDYIIKNADKIINANYYVRFSANEDFSKIYLGDNAYEEDIYEYKHGVKQSYFENIKEIAETNIYKFSVEYLRDNVGYRYLSKNETITIKKENRINKEDTKELEKYGFNLSSINQDGFVGREREIKEIIKAIGIKKKSVILVGESGSGKTAIVNEIAKNHMNRFLEGKIIYYINASSIIAGTKYRGDFEERFDKIIKICEKSRGNIILFIDEIHTLYGLGTSDDNKNNDALSILKPYIDNGKVIIIGATTKIEYNKYIANDPAFARRMEKIDIPNLTHDELLIVLLAYIFNLENKYNIDIDLDYKERLYVVEELLRITDKNRQKAIDNVKIINPAISKEILENAFVEAVYNESIFVTMDDIYYAVSSHSNLSDHLSNEMKDRLKNVVKNGRVKKRVKSNIIDFKEAKYSKI